MGEIYGDPMEHPQTEEYKGNVNPHGIRSCYDEGKRMGESLFFDYHRFYGVDIRVARLFNSYGSRMRIGDGRVVSNFVVQALRKQGLTVPVNIGNPNERTIMSLAQLVATRVAEVMERDPVQIVSRPLLADDPTRRMPDISLAKEKLGWEPKVDLEEGLTSTILHFKDVLKDELV